MSLKVGNRVYHLYFGYGKIIAMNSECYTIFFDKVDDEDTNKIKKISNKAPHLLRRWKNDFFESDLKRAELYLKEEKRKRNTWTGRIIQPKLNEERYY